MKEERKFCLSTRFRCRPKNLTFSLESSHRLSIEKIWIYIQVPKAFLFKVRIFKRNWRILRENMIKASIN